MDERSCETLAEALAVVFGRVGVEALNKGRALYSDVADFLPDSSLQNKKSLNLLRNAIQSGIPERIFSVLDKGVNTQKNTLPVCKQLLIDHYGVGAIATEEFMGGFAVALN